jgi:hypothetical protein
MFVCGRKEGYRYFLIQRCIFSYLAAWNRQRLFGASGGFVLRLGCIRAIRTEKLKEARYYLKVVTVCNFG